MNRSEREASHNDIGLLHSKATDLAPDLIIRKVPYDTWISGDIVD